MVAGQGAVISLSLTSFAGLAANNQVQRVAKIHSSFAKKFNEK